MKHECGTKTAYNTVQTDSKIPQEPLCNVGIWLLMKAKELQSIQDVVPRRPLLLSAERE